MSPPHRGHAPVGRLHLRRARPTDAEFVYRLAMLPDVRSASVRSDEFTLAEHMLWWRRRYGSRNTRIWIMEVDGTPSGYLRYSRIARGEPMWSGGPIADADGPAEVSIAIGPAQRGKGFATAALRLMDPVAARELSVDMLAALILPSNVASQRLFEKAGYRPSGEERRLGKRVLRYEKRLGA